MIRLGGAEELLRSIEHPAACQRAWEEVSAQVSKSVFVRLIYFLLWLIFLTFAVEASQKVLDVVRSLTDRVWAQSLAVWGMGGICVACGLGIPLVLARKRMRRAVREYLNSHGYSVCVRCGYDLQGQSTYVGRCPECGEWFAGNACTSADGDDAASTDANMGITARQYLEDLEILLRQYGEKHFAEMVANALSDSDEALNVFLASEELWGGVGSIADQAGRLHGRDAQKLIETILIRLGERQIRDGIIHARTATCVELFRQWQRQGI